MTVKTTSSSGAHSHTIDIVATDLSGIQGQITALDTRVKALESVKPVIPAPIPTPIPAPTTPAQRIVPFTPDQTAATLLALLADETIDVIEMATGTYHLKCMYININRTRPIVVRPATGATVVFSSADAYQAGQFHFGRDGSASNITMEGFTFDGYTLAQAAIIWVGNAHDITLNNMVVRNSHCNGTTAQPYHSWALYLSRDAGVTSSNITANNWTVDGSTRTMSALTMGGQSHVTATGWSVSHAYWAAYVANGYGITTDVILSDWTIVDTGNTGYEISQAIYIGNASGIISNMHLTKSGILYNVGTPKLIDGGGNTWA